MDMETKLRQRMRGTVGVFISMAGSTPDALASLPDAGERSILLLLNLALDRASYRGEAYVPLLELLAPAVTTPAVTFEVPSVAIGPLGAKVLVGDAAGSEQQVGLPSDRQRPTHSIRHCR